MGSILEFLMFFIVVVLGLIVYWVLNRHWEVRNLNDEEQPNGYQQGSSNKSVSLTDYSTRDYNDSKQGDIPVSKQKVDSVSGTLISKRKLTQLNPNEVINRAIRYFTTKGFTVSSQSGSSATFHKKEFSRGVFILLLIIGILTIGGIILPILYLIFKRNKNISITIDKSNAGYIVQSNDKSFIRKIPGEYLI